VNIRTVTDQNGTREEPFDCTMSPCVSFKVEEFLRAHPTFKKARYDFYKREDNPDHFDPESVVLMGGIYESGGCMDGGGLPLGSGALIRAAREIIASEESAQ
jgi:hypothetical protein